MEAFKFLTLASVLFTKVLIAQNQTRPTAVPFLNISPDARATGMGETGLATSANSTSIHWNTAKTAFSDQDGAFSINYSPYMRSLAKGMNFLNISGFYKTNYKSALSFQGRFLNMGEVIYRNDRGIEAAVFNPFDLAVGAGYAIKVGEGYSLGVNAKYIHSNTIARNEIEVIQSKTAHAYSVDLAVYNERYLADNRLSWGVTINNIGSKVKYGTGLHSFQPMSLKIGSALNMLAGHNGSITFALDLNKPLVADGPVYDDQENLISGRPLDDNIFTTAAHSFTTGGLKNSLRAVGFSFGTEYEFLQQFFLRGGVVYENPKKGERRFGTVGAGFSFNHFNVDAAYLLPFSTENAFGKTLNLSLSFNID